MMQVGNLGISRITALTKLTYLSLAGCENTSDASLSIVATMTQLQSLNLMWSRVTERGQNLASSKSREARGMKLFALQSRSFVCLQVFEF